MFEVIICVNDDKMSILEKARAAGLDFRLACPDGLASMEKGITVGWYGKANLANYGELSQFRLSIKNIDILSMTDGEPLISFLKSLDGARPVSPNDGKYYSAVKALVERGVFAGLIE